MCSLDKIFLYIFVHFYFALFVHSYFTTNIEGGREYKSARVKALLQKCEWDKRLLKDLEEAIMSLEITEDKIYYQEIVLTSQNETEEVLCILAKYAVDLLDILLDAKLKIAGLEREFEDFLEFIYSIEASE